MSDILTDIARRYIAPGRITRHGEFAGMGELGERHPPGLVLLRVGRHNSTLADPPDDHLRASPRFPPRGWTLPAEMARGPRGWAGAAAISAT
jgi:hypothetical protein